MPPGPTAPCSLAGLLAVAPGQRQHGGSMSELLCNDADGRAARARVEGGSAKPSQSSPRSAEHGNLELLRCYAVRVMLTWSPRL